MMNYEPFALPYRMAKAIDENVRCSRSVILYSTTGTLVKNETGLQIALSAHFQTRCTPFSCHAVVN